MITLSTAPASENRNLEQNTQIVLKNYGVQLDNNGRKVNINGYPTLHHIYSMNVALILIVSGGYSALVNGSARIALMLGLTFFGPAIS